MKLFVLAVCVACALGSSISKWEEDWFAWKAKFGKSYIETEEDNRRQIWERNLRYIVKHNYEHSLGKHTFTVGMNQYGDLTNEEFGALYLSRMSGVSANMCMKSQTEDKLVFLPSSVDWRKEGYVTPIKNQGQCGSCWAFSTTGSIEGQHFNATGNLVSLSEQNLMDCSKPEGDFSCEGGLMDYAFDYVIINGGIDTEASYPYLAMDERTCKFTKADIGATISSCVDLPSGDESALQKAVAEVGPISVAIDASHSSFQLYRDGVYYEPECSSTVLDHGVLAIGYGTEKDKDYWLVKNSWGTDWGSQGFLKMSRNRNNNCGIATNASYPVV